MIVKLQIELFGETLENQKAPQRLQKLSQRTFCTVRNRILPKGLNELKFFTLGKIREQDQIEFIQIGFYLNQPGNSFFLLEF